MSSFVIKRTLKLDKHGDGWEGAFVTLREPTVEEIQRMGKLEEDDDKSFEIMVGILKNCLIEGKAYDGEKLVDVKGEDITKFPTSIFNEVINFLTPDVKK